MTVKYNTSTFPKPCERKEIAFNSRLNIEILLHPRIDLPSSEVETHRNSSKAGSSFPSIAWSRVSMSALMKALASTNHAWWSLLIYEMLWDVHVPVAILGNFSARLVEGVHAWPPHLPICPQSSSWSHHWEQFPFWTCNMLDRCNNDVVTLLFMSHPSAASTSSRTPTAHPGWSKAGRAPKMFNFTLANHLGLLI